jgi:ElaB/YqjD/DUF883 family membrane-anchored ribosome-binding protein
MSDDMQRAAAATGETIQQKAAETQDVIETYVRENPMMAALMALGIGYVLGKII